MASHRSRRPRSPTRPRTFRHPESTSGPGSGCTSYCRWSARASFFSVRCCPSSSMASSPHALRPGHWLRVELQGLPRPLCGHARPSRQSSDTMVSLALLLHVERGLCQQQVRPDAGRSHPEPLRRRHGHCRLCSYELSRCGDERLSHLRHFLRHHCRHRSSVPTLRRLDRVAVHPSRAGVRTMRSRPTTARVRVAVADVSRLFQCRLWPAAGPICGLRPSQLLHGVQSIRAFAAERRYQDRFFKSCDTFQSTFARENFLLSS